MNVKGMNNISFKARMVLDPQMTKKNMIESLEKLKSAERVKFEKAVNHLTSPTIKKLVQSIGTDEDTLHVGVQLSDSNGIARNSLYIVSSVKTPDDYIGLEWHPSENVDFENELSKFLEKLSEITSLKVTPIVEKLFKSLEHSSDQNK